MQRDVIQVDRGYCGAGHRLRRLCLGRLALDRLSLGGHCRSSGGLGGAKDREKEEGSDQNADGPLLHWDFPAFWATMLFSSSVSSVFFFSHLMAPKGVARSNFTLSPASVTLVN